MKEPWERRQDESDKAFQAFQVYRDLGPKRSYRSVAQRLGKAGSLVSRWSSRHQWVSRSAAFDAEADRVRVGEMLDEARNMGRSHGMEAKAVKASLVATAVATATRLREDTAWLRDGVKGLSLKEAVELMLQIGRVLPMLQTAERLAMGQPTEIIAAYATVGVRHEELQKAAAVADRVLHDPEYRQAYMNLLELEGRDEDELLQIVDGQEESPTLEGGREVGVSG